MARTPFKLRSGNSTPFKKMGSSPLKDTQYFGQNTTVEESSAVTAHNKKHKDGSWDKDHKTKSPAKKTYKEAYADADQSKYDTYEKFETAAKAWNVKKYGTTEPTKVAKERKTTKEGLAKGVTKGAERTKVLQTKIKAKDAFDAKVAKQVSSVSDADKAANLKAAKSKVTRKDIRKHKKATIKAARSKAKTSKADLKEFGAGFGGSGKSERKDIRQTRRAEVKAARQGAKAANKERRELRRENKKASPAKQEEKKSFGQKVAQGGEDIKKGISDMMPWNAMSGGPRDPNTNKKV